MKYLYSLRVKPFTERAYSIPLGVITRDQAFFQYAKMVQQLSLKEGGYLQLFEGNERIYPILAQRIGNPPSEPSPETVEGYYTK